MRIIKDDENLKFVERAELALAPPESSLGIQSVSRLQTTSLLMAQICSRWLQFDRLVILHGSTVMDLFVLDDSDETPALPSFLVICFPRPDILRSRLGYIRSCSIRASAPSVNPSTIATNAVCL